ncbi:DUF1295 domain-containing protein [Bradyrhizobium sp. U87765 SZCCT0131]|uniref:DUF1295 domain-containing protein n=1 Tax=unclassified Bradyrhizobium TaxID=2631580 RepID=UPI001BAA59D1|nr:MULTISPECIES: DUF1295 domain-containing protein [unclassified Bradyrhizobium]MBR1220853.1 DUF1295 domain-containing protein [Bradyrhizobium sp. U87765 SZCCT0131]MBR1260327.1 DUF1295 domain-containing protein [Bradyrhizobium sp. U87765 SZCCT0134]MBR1307424.1 DUF1295 domain-containing protein [Bradyrhizobium sp. U87765 SZCCT0110]MBR1321378.1 DUF1295 domain-containing protein [Bradyrhizobium sp. U87765 SZCCT0109]MBR1349691.1 DUF1295 domain-containing protein [Bradyrhizobium sp. U87765 SZCCT004
MVFVVALVLMAVAFAVCMAGAWLVQQRTGNSGWVDTIWTFSLGVIGAAGALWPLQGSIPGPRQWLVAALIALWALRLGSHIAQRSAGITDDPRYARFAADWGAEAPRRMFVFLQNQALGSLPLVFAIFVAAHAPRPLDAQDLLGALLLAAGIAGEAVADTQLKRFRGAAVNRGRVCDAGLWRLSRHPNYFFQWLGWLAYPVMAISFADPLGYPWGFAALPAPLVMYWILVHVTGIPPLEEQMLRSRGDAYRAYQARTSRFFPWSPRVAADR